MMYYFTESKWYGPLEISKPNYADYETQESGGMWSVDIIKFESDIEVWEKHLASLPSGDSLIPQFAGMVKEEGKDFVFEYTNKFPLVGKSYTIKTAVAEEDEQKKTIIEIMDADQKDGLYAEEGNNNNRQLAVDFAWENSYRLNSLDGYQSFIKIFNDWYSKNDYHKKKAEEGKQTFSERLYKQLKHIYDQYSDEWTEHNEKETAELLTEYLKTKQ